MAKTFKRMSGTLLASAALATAGLLATAPAQAIDMRCRNAVHAYCSANWQAAGYYDYWDCFVAQTESVCHYPNYGEPGPPYLAAASRD